MGAKLSSSVADLSAEQRRVLESVIGQPLEDDQVLHWFLSRSGRQPTPRDKTIARAGLEGIFAKVDEHLAASGIREDQFNTAVDEAVDSCRSRPK